MLGWFLYLKIAFKVVSLVLLTKGLLIESRFCTIFEKKLFIKTLAVSKVHYSQVHYFQLNFIFGSNLIY